MPDCFDELDKFSCVQPDLDTNEDNFDFLKALEELSGYARGEEDKSEPLSESLATIRV